MQLLTRLSRVTIGVVLTANALDLSTAWIGSDIDRAGVPLAPRSPWTFTIQLVLLIPLIVGAAKQSRAAVAAVRALPLPRAPFVAAGLFFALQAGHVVFRQENYPFSPVIMFSNVEPDLKSEWREASAAVIERPGGMEIVNFMREGDRLACRYLCADYKTGWLLFMYARDIDEAFAVAASDIAEAGAPRPTRRRVAYRLTDGAVHVLPL